MNILGVNMKDINVTIEEVIKLEFVSGDGTKENPIRTVIQYWDKDGVLLFTIDPVN